MASHKNQGIRCNLPEPADTFCGNPVPGAGIGFIRYLVQQLKRNISGVCEMSRHFFPQTVKTFLVSRAVKKAFLVISGIKGKADSFMQIKDYLQSVPPRAFQRVSDPAESVRVPAAVFVFHDIVVHGDAHMIQSPAGYHPEILFCDEVIHPVFRIITLGEPSAQVHTPVKAVILHFHGITSLFPVP